MRNSEYRTSFSKLNQKIVHNSYFDNLVYRRSRRNYESNHDHLVFCWDDEDYWSECKSTSTASCDGNDSASTSSRHQVAAVKDENIIKDNKVQHNESSKSVKCQGLKNEKNTNKTNHAQVKKKKKENNFNLSPNKSQLSKELPTKSVATQTVSIKESIQKCLQKSTFAKESTKSCAKKEKKNSAGSKVANMKFLQKRPLVAYGIGWKDDLCGSRRTFNIQADNGVYKSARNAYERRKYSKHQANYLSVNKEESISKNDKNPNLWDASAWKTEYQRCFSA
ncbi:hypothetical protein TrispH2_000357 [Trichoplax sp. H2]|uniref:Uncharacterized protein n=1 Tax=Trichoplax adhaerens TaxID=10228 RepID=B3S6E2_TRIAD|nr:predicted protein [Trichoplax adhaerens]EDV21605.1 predicted protein [Trichoplax adhaerens]RDD47486.1 hypothetical protein TrispH2_000357 [Trichoplax sp. H2]|eukprot:XP_002115753.1 predicted protein [Trichoplax adhaerens]